MTQHDYIKITHNLACNVFISLVLIMFTTACTITNTGLKSDPKMALANGILAGSLGQDLNTKNLRRAVKAEISALSDGAAGASLKWDDSDDIRGAVTPGQPYEIGGVKCRRYVHAINIKGDVKSGTGTACLSQEGYWQPQD